MFHLTNILGGRFVSAIPDAPLKEEIVDLLNSQAQQWFAETTVGREYRGGLRKIEPRELSALPVAPNLLALVGVEDQTIHMETGSLFE